MTRRHDPRRAKAHRTYSRIELSEIFNVRLPTLSAWVNKGLKPIDHQRPYLFSGRVVREFLTLYNKPRQPTAPGELYCVACKRVVKPAGGVVKFLELNNTSGNFVGRCPDCLRSMYQRVRISDIEKKRGNLTVVYEDNTATINEITEPPCTGSFEELLK